MKRALLAVVAVIAATISALGAPTQVAAADTQFVLFDQVLQHKVGSYAQPTVVSSPANWTSPVDYSNGKVYVRVDVTAKPSAKPLQMQLCMWRSSYTQETCAGTYTFTGTGVHYFDLGKPSSWWKKGGVWSWATAFSPVRFMIKDPITGKLMMNSACGEGCYTGSENLLDHTPLTLDASVVVVAPGAALVPPPKWTGCPANWSPVCTNTAPVVNAGADSQGQWSMSPVALPGTATDDGLPSGSTLTRTWSKVAGPGDVAFANASAASTTAVFTLPGVYTLQLAASDGLLNSSDQVVVNLRPPSGGGTAALVTARGGTPLANDAPYVTWLTALGFTVQVIDDNVVDQATLDAADLVVISSTVTPNLIPAWISTVDTPILNSEAFLSNKLGLGTTGRQVTGIARVEIVNANSPVAAGFSGLVNVVTTTTVGGLTGIGQNVDLVARFPGANSATAAIVSADKGVNLSTGLAPQRRIGFFLEAGTPPRIVSGGRALFDAAVSWLTYVAPPALPWWDNAWAYRLEVSASSGIYARAPHVIEQDVDLTPLLAPDTATLSVESLRVVEVDFAGTILDAAVPFQFDLDPAFNATSNAKGRLTIVPPGASPAGSVRWFHLYFDTPTAGHPAVSFPARVTITDGVTDEGQASYRIDLDNTSWYYQKAAGGFSSLVDEAGRDWISYSTAPGATGVFRGIPNAVHPAGHFHPGATTSITTLVSSGPLRVTLESRTADNAWQARWEFFPTSARMTMLKAPASYWLLYEGTPGGSIGPEDVVHRSPSATSGITSTWSGDLPGPEWVAFADTVVGSAIYVGHPQNDSAVDSYSLMDNAMTVMGFGRSGLVKALTGMHQLTVGIVRTANGPTIANAGGASASLPQASVIGRNERPV